MSRLNNKKGFTLIELVIVLAIAALILAAVLLAVGGAQRSRRDTQRKNDAGTISSQLEQYASNNAGVYPGTGYWASAAGASYSAGTMGASYFSNLFDPKTGNTYALVYGVATTAPAVGTIEYSSSATCSGQVAVASANSRQYALVVGLEAGGSSCYGN